MTRKQLLLSLIVLMLMPSFSNCNKLIEGGGRDTITNQKIFSDDSGAMAALVGIYYKMMNEPGNLMNGGVSILAGLSADEVTPLKFDKDIDFFLNDLKAYNPILSDSLWSKGYRYIYHCNVLIEGLNKPNTISAALRNRIIGEAKCLRSLCYYYLIQLFGDVPLVTSTEIRTNGSMARTPIATIYQQLVGDLKDAASLLDNEHSNAFTSKLSCEALLARIYLHLGDWVNAEAYSTAVIGSGRFELESLENVFKVNSREVIFQLQPADYPFNAIEGYLFQVPLNGTEPRYTLSKGLVNSFESNDLRKKQWIKSVTINGINYHQPWKYRVAMATAVSNEYNVVMRLAEQYLIRAEARARQSLIAGAMIDLNIIRDRAALPLLHGAMSMEDCLQAIETERRHELFSEWGHRWIDLKRTKRINAILSSKWQHWESEKQLFPIPEIEIALNPKLEQNDGY